MVVLNDICVKCYYVCNSIHFQRNFKIWTSGNNDIDEFIQSTQLSAHEEVLDALEWIPYDRFYDIKYIAGGESNKMYRANWIDGCIVMMKSWHQSSWDDYNQNWKRGKPNIFVIMKILNNPTSITSEFIDKV
jgi:hypothetical protein